MIVRRIITVQFAKKFSSQETTRISETIPKDEYKGTHEKSLNIVQLIGRVGQAPITTQKLEKKTTIFALATNEYQGLDENNEVKNRVDWHRIVVFLPYVC